jgi:hypothetical protein
MALCGGQTGLCRRRSDAPQGFPDGPAEVPRQIERLIESACAAARGMERDGNEAVASGEHLGTAFSHQVGERPRQRPASLVFQRVHDRPQRSFVAADCTAAIHGRLRPAATRASRERHADDPPGRQWISA